MDTDVRQQLEAIPGPAGTGCSTPHPVGTTVAIRSIRDFPDREPAVSFAVAGTVLQDDEDLTVVMTRPGSDRASRAGRRTGPRGRNVVVTGWDGTHDVAAWEGSTVVRVHPRGRCWSLWRWHDGENWVGDWYGNLESPWRRGAVGYDTQDWALDVVAEGAPGTGSWSVRFKDEDELDWYVEQGAFSPERAAYFRSVGVELADLLRRGFRRSISGLCRSRRVGSTSRDEPCDMMSWCRRRHLARHPDHRRSHGPLARPHQGPAHLVAVPDHGPVRGPGVGAVGGADRE